MRACRSPPSKAAGNGETTAFLAGQTGARGDKQQLEDISRRIEVREVSVEPIEQHRGVSRARVICDTCERDEVVACAYVRGVTQHATSPNESQARSKVIALGWSFVKGKLRCPACEAKRKASHASKEKVMATEKTNVAQIRQPTPEQEVDIIVTLSSVYDRKAKRYQGKETDKTVAETVGGGVMPGWVATIREEKFGPAGNEELETIKAEIELARTEFTQKLDALSRRVEACVSAHDRRVRA